MFVLTVKAFKWRHFPVNSLVLLTDSKRFRQCGHKVKGQAWIKWQLAVKLLEPVFSLVLF